MEDTRVTDEQLLAALGEASKVDEVVKYFRFSHLPEGRLRDTSKAFALMVMTVLHAPRCPERTVALRKLLEAKDAAVRACLP